MTRAVRIAALCGVWLVGWAGAGAPAQGATGESSASKRPVYKTADELREGCARYLKPMDPGEAKARPYHDYLLFVVPYLDSENVELRDAAADILAQVFRLRRHVPASAFSKYLSRDYPLNVRVVALAHSLYGARANKGEMSTYVERRAAMEEAWTETLNDIAESPVTPANFDLLVFALMIRHDCLTLVKPENQPVMVRRLLAVVSGASWDDRQRAMPLICCYPADTVAREVVAWYRVQPDAHVRAVCVDWIGKLAGGVSFSLDDKPLSVDELKALLPVFELAVQDPDPEIAKRARESLEKAEAFLEKKKALSEEDGR